MPFGTVGFPTTGLNVQIAATYSAEDAEDERQI
jgi:hypothetical protein